MQRKDRNEKQRRREIKGKTTKEEVMKRMTYKRSKTGKDARTELGRDEKRREVMMKPGKEN